MCIYTGIYHSVAPDTDFRISGKPQTDDRDYMLRDVTRTQGMQLGITVLLLRFALVLIIYTIRNMDASVKSVVQGMQEVKKGNLDVLVPVQSFDEIGTITDNFNEMTVKVRELIREVTEAQENQKNAEIRALEAQINPHFLYNTLDSIMTTSTTTLS